MEILIHLQAHPRRNNEEVKQYEAMNTSADITWPLVLQQERYSTVLRLHWSAKEAERTH